MKCLQDMRTSLPRSVWVWRVGTLGCGGRVAASPYLVSGHFLIEHRRKSTPSVLPTGSNTSPFFFALGVREIKVPGIFQYFYIPSQHRGNPGLVLVLRQGMNFEWQSPSRKRPNLAPSLIFFWNRPLSLLHHRDPRTNLLILRRYQGVCR